MIRTEIPQLLLALFAGAAAVTAYAPLEWWWVMPVSIATLASMLTHVQSGGKAFRLGLAWGLGLYLAGVSWVYVSLNVYGGMPLWMGSIAVLGFCSLLAAFCALPCWLAVKFTNVPVASANNVAPRLALLVVLWLVFEWAKSWVLTGFPWLDIGYTQTPSWLFSLAPVGGVYLVSFALMCVSVSLAYAINRHAQRSFRLCALICVVLIFALSFGLQHQTWTQDDGEPLAVGIVQPNTMIETKWQSRYRDEVIARLAGETSRMVTQAADPVELVVWPETALALSYQQTDDAFWRALVPPQTALISGLVDIPRLEESYNAAVLVCDGERKLYRKRHLVPFGEYLPLRFLFNWVLEYLELPMSDFSAWSAPQSLTCGELLNIGLSICYEDAFANEHRVFNKQASLLVNISEDAWFGNSLAPHQRLQMAQMRARELSRPMVRSANSGPSAFIDHKGQIQQRSDQFELAAIRQLVRPQTGDTPYARFGNWIVWFCLVIAGAIIFAGRRRA